MTTSLSDWSSIPNCDNKLSTTCAASSLTIIFFLHVQMFIFYHSTHATLYSSINKKKLAWWGSFTKHKETSKLLSGQKEIKKAAKVMGEREGGGTDRYGHWARMYSIYKSMYQKAQILVESFWASPLLFKKQILPVFQNRTFWSGWLIAYSCAFDGVQKGIKAKMETYLSQRWDRRSKR